MRDRMNSKFATVCTLQASIVSNNICRTAHRRWLRRRVDRDSTGLPNAFKDVHPPSAYSYAAYRYKQYFAQILEKNTYTIGIFGIQIRITCIVSNRDLIFGLETYLFCFSNNVYEFQLKIQCNIRI